MKTPEPISQQRQWLDLLSEYDITIQHRPGRVHGNSDALSRRPCDWSEDSDCQQCLWATRTPVAVPVSSTALLADDYTAAGTAPLSSTPFTPDKSSNLPPSSLPDTASDQLQSLVPPVSSDEATHALPTDDVMARKQVLEISSKPLPITMDDIREAQSADNSLQLVVQALQDSVKPPHGSLRDYPEEACVLFLQWDSLVFEAGVLQRRYHYPDGTTKYLQVVLPAKL